MSERRFGSTVRRHGTTYDKEISKISIIKLMRGDYNYEIVVDPATAEKYIENEDMDINEVLLDKHIFSDAKDGKQASEHTFKESFGTDDPTEIARIIFKEGQGHLIHKKQTKHLFG